jgi:hypothetical protein
MTILKLYHKDRLIGLISNIAPEDTFEMSGDIALTAVAQEYKEKFAYLSDEDALTNGTNPPFDESFLNGWYLEQPDGERKPIDCPGICFPDGEVFWRES